MASIVLTPSDGSSFLGKSGVPTTTRPYDSSSDFVARVTEIVKGSSESRDYTHIREQLQKLRSSLPTDVPFKETLNALIAQVKEVTPRVDLPVVYRHLIQDLELVVNKDYLALANLSPSDEAFRMECAFLAAKAFPTKLALNIRKYGITNQEALFNLATILANSSPTALADCVKNFGITQEKGRIALAKIAIATGEDIFALLPNFEIQDETALVELTLLAIEKNHKNVMRSVNAIGIKKEENLFVVAKALIEKSTAGSAFYIESLPITNEEMRFELAKCLAKIHPDWLALTLRKFKITSEKARIEIAELVAMHNGAALSERIANFEITDQQALFRLAQVAAHKNGPDTSRHIQRFGISDPIQLVEVCLIALRQNIRSANYIACYGFDFEQKALLYSKFGTEFIEELANAFQILVSDQSAMKSLKIIEQYPEYIGFGVDSNLASCALDLWEADGIPFSSIASLYQRARLLDKEPLKNGSKEQMLISLEISAQRFANGSPELLEVLLGEIRKIGSEENPRTFKQLAFNMFSLLLKCRVLKIDNRALLKHQDIFKEIMGIRDAETRTDLVQHFVTWLSTSPGPLSLKPKALLATILLSSFVPKMEKFQKLIRLKGFKDELKLKSLLHSLAVLVNDPILRDEEKLRILNELIFVEVNGLNADSQAKRILESAESVTQFLNCGQSQALIGLKNFAALSKEKVTLYHKMLGIPLKLCDTALPQTIEKWRKPQSLLSYAYTLSKLSSFERDKLLGLLQKFTLSVLNGTFQEERYATGKEASWHWMKVQEQSPELMQEWRKGYVWEKGDFIIVDSDHPCDLLLAGTEMGTCQSVNGDPSFAKCLVAYLLDPKIRMMAVKNKAGVIVARSMIRLLWDESSKRFVLFQEHNYSNNNTIHSKKLDSACIARATALGVPLYRKGINPELQGTTLKAFKGTIPFEYVDSTDIHIETERGYEIPQCECCYMPQEKV